LWWQAAIAYGLHAKRDGVLTVFIFDLGGGTFDVSVVTIEDGVFEVKATAGDTHLGGEDFDSRLVDHCIEEFKRKFRKDISTNERAKRRLRTACERAKRTLSTAVTAAIEIDALFEGVDYSTVITRAKFEELNAADFARTIEHVRDVLVEAGTDRLDVDEVVLVGGSTRIPKIQDMLRDYFGGKEPNKSVNPDEAVAYGATVQAAIIAKIDMTGGLDHVLLVDVTPLSLGVAVIGDLMSVIIKRNSTIPSKHTQTYYTTSDDQTSATIKVYEGEREMVKDNTLLGSFEVVGIPPLPARKAAIEVTFAVEATGFLVVSAKVTATGATRAVAIRAEKGRLNTEEIERMRSDAER
jgi:L1 cell adhesion molecule like protein